MIEGVDFNKLYDFVKAHKDLQAHRGYAFGYSDVGVRADGNDGESRAGNQRDGGKDGTAEREHRNASQKGGFDFCK